MAVRNALEQKRYLDGHLHFNSNILNSFPLFLGEYQGLSWDSTLSFLTSNPILGYPILVAVTSIAAFVMYGWDKRQAKTSGCRIPEKQLHALAFLGGWPGAMLGQNFFRHKTQKTEFKIMLWLAAGLHILLVLWILFSRFTE